MGIAPAERDAVRHARGLIFGKAEQSGRVKSEGRRPKSERNSKSEWNSHFLGVTAAVFFLLLSSPNALAQPAQTSPTVILVVGAPGEPEYGSNFLQQASLWEKACQQGNARAVTIGVDYPEGTNDLDLLKATLAELPKQSSAPLWLVLIGHGSFDGKEAWFNLRGPDFSGSDLAGWLKPFQRPMAVINTASCSGPFINKLSATNRVVITATRSGNEQNFARFGQHLARALTDSQADLDQDGEISLLEAFLTASHEANEFYKAQGRLITEHALIDDNGDGLGTPVEWFRGLRAARKAKDSVTDGALAQQFCLVPSPAERALSPEQITQRDALEKQVLALRDKKSSIPEDDYYQQLETLLLQLARFYASGSATNAVH